MITLVHITGRRDPKWEWYVNSLMRQIPVADLKTLQFVFIDGQRWGNVADDMSLNDMVWDSASSKNMTRGQALREIVADRFEYDHLPPLPNVFQGPFRKTSRDLFFAGNNRNSGAVAARGDYIMFCDDLAWCGPQWYAQVKHAAHHKYLLAGMYQKRKNMIVEDGVLVSSEEFPPGIDSRWSSGSDLGIVPWHGSGVFGCSFGMPLETYLTVDGCGIETAGMGAEDYCLAMRAERTGLPVMLNRNCLTYESEEDHHVEPSLPRMSKPVSPDRLPPGYTGSTSNDWVHVNRLKNEPNRILPLFPNNLREIRRRYMETGLVPIPQEPTTDWRDGTPLSEL